MVACRRSILFPIVVTAVVACQRAPGPAGTAATLGFCQDSVTGTSVPCRMARDSVSGTTAQASLASFVLRDVHGAVVPVDSLRASCHDSANRAVSCRIEIAIDTVARVPDHPADPATP